MKNSDINVGDTLIANAYCGFPDGTTKGNEYIVSRISNGHDQRLFWITNDENKEVLPISTKFTKKEGIN